MPLARAAVQAAWRPSTSPFAFSGSQTMGVLLANAARYVPSRRSSSG
ncbi:hypothetical protein ACFQX7_34300 [Luedemannella flava]